MKRLIVFFSVFFSLLNSAEALQIKHFMKTSIGVFDACEQTLTYGFFNNKDYDVKTTMSTTGVFGTLYPFSAMYHAVGTYEKDKFWPQDYFSKTKSFTHKRTKELVYENGIPQYRISTKNEKTRRDAVTLDEKYGQSADLLSIFGMLIEQINRTGNCDFERYSFNGKRYTFSKVKTLGKEKIKTDFFTGKALKCQYYLENADGGDAGFMLSKDEPAYFWALKDSKTGAYFLARIVVENTPFGQLESVTTKIEVTK